MYWGVPFVPTPTKPSPRVTIKDGTEFAEKELREWAQDNFSSIGLERRQLPLIRELARLVLEYDAWSKS